ncbi:YhgE/Pip domain-containing protein [Pallidibacillus thermolactis]|uniref:YhgE/Pip domain-containing protein n=1 Tax=Pallidibacillus thermolactis TaxID=251051 RepID=UPI0021D8010B|nr:YhgE/Pip domain-containing protein [Pallidibacillus thermolactis]MCU9602399.1 YhgE/Pip domain-containing protein [Pallidibacillus thermolactis subsp. kokeshiiformis]
MRNVINIFKQDLRNIKRVPLFALILLAIAVLPALYAWFNLESTWDPYANTKGIQIAVVNEDEGVEIEGESINIGEEIVHSLKENQDFGWNFISKREAEKGVKLGNLYAAIYIDKNFSSNLVKVLDGNPTQAEIVYQVNEKMNAIAPKMTSAGANAVVSKINDKLIEETSKALLEQLDKLGIKMEEELPTMRKIKRIVDEIHKSFPEINHFAESLMEIEENWDKIDNRIEQFIGLQDYFPQIDKGAEYIFRLEEQLPKINQIGNEVLKIEQSIPELEKAVEKLTIFRDRFTEVGEQLKDGLEKANVAKEKIAQMQNLIPVLEENREYAEEFLQIVESLKEQAAKTDSTMSEIFLQQIQFVSETATLTDQVIEEFYNKDSLEEATKYVTNLNEQLTNQIAVIDQIIKYYELMNQKQQNEQIQDMIDKLTVLRNKMETLQQSVNSLQNEINNGNFNSEKLKEIREKNQAVEEASTTLMNMLNSEQGKNLTTAFMDLMERIEQSNSGLENLYSELESLGNVLNLSNDIVNKSGETIERLINELPDVEAKVNKLVDITEEELPKVVNTIENLTKFVNEKLPSFEKLVHNVAQMMKTDYPKMKEKYKNIATLLTEKAPKVKNSLHDINRYSREYLPEFEHVIDELADRFKKIEEEDQINKLIVLLRNDLDKESEFFANPVDLKEEHLFEIPNYGSANAPFYTTLSIWVGALLLSNLISTNVHPIDMRKEYTLRHVYFGKLIIFLIIGILQSLIVSVGNLLLLGVYTKHPVFFVVFSMLISIVLMTIVYTLVSIFGNIGKGLAIILLVLQLSSSGGTFPIDVTPPFFQAIHPFLPFTYAINLLREAVAGAIPVLVVKYISILLIFMVLTLLVGALLKPLLAERIEAAYEKTKASRMLE